MYRKLMMLLTILIIVSCNQEETKKETFVFEGKRNVKTTKAYRGNINKYLEYSGKIVAADIANVSSVISAEVNKVLVEIGDYVSKDDLLVKLDKSQLEKTEIQLKNAENNYKRMKKLFENDVIDKQTFEEIETKYNSLKSSYDYMIDNMEVKAPISGIVTQIYKQEGEKFDAMMDPFLVRIINSDKFKAKANISDKDITKIEIGQQAIITLDNDEEKISGLISYISPEADVLSGKFLLEINIDNKSVNCKHNQFARIKLIIDNSQNTIIIPQSAVLGDSVVYTVEQDKAVKKNVSLGIGNEYYIEVNNGIQAGDIIITEGNVGLSDGGNVRIIQ